VRPREVDQINAGYTETEGADRIGFVGSDQAKQMVTETPLGRAGQPEDIARVAVFLASVAFGWLTGEFLLASGGLR
jgi:3-oxoacyl-[acyl-carrier protein] reductase